MFRYADQLKEEMSLLVFARVSKVVLPEAHKATVGVGVDGKNEDSYEHYFGFAKIEKGSSIQGTVWFKRATHLSRNGGFFFGPVSHVPPYTKKSELPKRGDTIVGKLIQGKKGRHSFAWWTHDANPFMNFRSFVNWPKKLNNEPRAFSMLKLSHTRNNTCDDLYLLAQIVLKNNVDLLVSQLLEKKDRPRHPWLKDATGYQRKRGFLVEFHPVQFAYFSSLFVKSIDIYKTFIEKIKKNPNVEYPEELLNQYTLEKLEKHIESISRNKKELE